MAVGKVTAETSRSPQATAGSGDDARVPLLDLRVEVVVMDASQVESVEVCTVTYLEPTWFLWWPW